MDPDGRAQPCPPDAHAKAAAAEEAKATARALGAEAQVLAARVTNDQLTAALKRVTHERDAAREGLQFAEKANAAMERERFAACERSAGLVALLRDVHANLESLGEVCKCCSPHLAERIEKAVRS